MKRSGGNKRHPRTRRGRASVHPGHLLQRSLQLRGEGPRQGGRPEPSARTHPSRASAVQQLSLFVASSSGLGEETAAGPGAGKGSIWPCKGTHVLLLFEPPQSLGTGLAGLASCAFPYMGLPRLAGQIHLIHICVLTAHQLLGWTFREFSGEQC